VRVCACVCVCVVGLGGRLGYSVVLQSNIEYLWYLMMPAS
jgi:hypothetical protein